MDGNNSSEAEREYWDAKAEGTAGYTTRAVISKHVLCALHLLGDIEGKRVLECGCGKGATTAMLSQKSTVYSFDISEEMVRLAEVAVRRNGFESNVHLKQMDFCHMDYDDESFELAFGSFVLHHLPDLGRAGAELHRVMRPRAKAIFIETWGGNPVLRYLRTFLIKRSASLRALASPGENPLTERDIATFSKSFSQCRILFPYFYFWQMVPRLRHLSLLRGMSDTIMGQATILIPDRVLGRR